MRLAVVTAMLLASATAGAAGRTIPARTTSSFDPATTSALVRALATELERQRIPALLVRVERPDGPVFRAAVGTRELGGRVPAAPEDCVRVGSLTKLLVAVAAMRLVEQGGLALDDRVDRWIPTLPRAQGITVEQLLSHHAGLPDVLSAWTLVETTLLPRTTFTRSELLAKISRDPSAKPAQYRYSNGNYVALGLVLESATGRPIQSALEEAVIRPARLERTTLLPAADVPACLLTGHDRDLTPFGLDVLPRHVSFASLAWTSGAIASTADDLAAVVRGIRDATLVSPRTRELMLPTHAIRDADHETAVGLGLFRFDLGGTRLVGHQGVFIGSQAFAGWAEEDGTIVVVLGNRSRFDIQRIVLAVLTAARRGGAPGAESSAPGGGPRAGRGRPTPSR